MKNLITLAFCGLLSSTMVIACGSDDDDKKPATGGTGGATGGQGGATGGQGGATGGTAGTSGSGGATGGQGGTSGAGGLPTGQIDRMGRPAISTALIATANKDAYNQAAPAGWAAFATEIETSLDTIDGLDGDKTNGLLAATRSVLAGVIADDQVQIDISVADCDGAYLGLELQVPNKCGGRTLAQDVVDTTLQALVDASGTTKVSDDAGPNDKAFTDAFPYLAAPH
jgi:hypothetical protein